MMKFTALPRLPTSFQHWIHKKSMKLLKSLKTTSGVWLVDDMAWCNWWAPSVFKKGNLSEGVCQRECVRGITGGQGNEEGLGFAY